MKNEHVKGPTQPQDVGGGCTWGVLVIFVVVLFWLVQGLIVVGKMIYGWFN